MKKAIKKELHFFFSIPALAWQILFLWLPMLVLLVASFYTTDGFTIQHYNAVVNITHFRVIFRSIFLAFINAFLCMLFAYPIAYFLAFTVRRSKDFFLFLLTLPFWVNFLLHVYGWFFMLERNGLINKFLMGIGIIKTPLMLANSMFAIRLVMFHSYLPFMVLPLYMIFEKLRYSLLESSYDLGASFSQTFFRIIFPLTISGAQIGFLLVFILSFGEFIIPTLLGGGKTLFVGTLISNYFLLNHNIHLGAAFTTVSACSLAVALACIIAGFKYTYYRMTKVGA